jgi:hypothetical protein
LEAEGGEFEGQGVFAPGTEGVEAAGEGAIGAVGLTLEKFEEARGVAWVECWVECWVGWQVIAGGGFVAGGLGDGLKRTPPSGRQRD